MANAVRGDPAGRGGEHGTRGGEEKTRIGNVSVQRRAIGAGERRWPRGWWTGRPVAVRARRGEGEDPVRSVEGVGAVRRGGDRRCMKENDELEARLFMAVLPPRGGRDGCVELGECEVANLYVK
jgi:hypothetical protein